MRRLFWVAVGAAAGVYAVRRVQRTLHAYSPAGLATRAGGLGETLQAFGAEVQARTAEREEELRTALGLTDGTAMTPREAADLTDHPASPRPRRTPAPTTTPPRSTT